MATGAGAKDAGEEKIYKEEAMGRLFTSLLAVTILAASAFSAELGKNQRDAVFTKSLFEFLISPAEKSREKGRAWWQERDQRMSSSPNKDKVCKIFVEYEARLMAAVFMYEKACEPVCWYIKYCREKAPKRCLYVLEKLKTPRAP